MGGCRWPPSYLLDPTGIPPGWALRSVGIFRVCLHLGNLVQPKKGPYSRIDRHYLELVAWATNMEKAREAAASFAQSQAFHDLVVNGIAPDGSFEWSNTGIVRALHQAVVANADAGWARLDDVRTWLANHEPEQTPEKYGCRTWPQVASHSKLFDLQYRMSADGRKEAWIRERGQS